MLNLPKPDKNSLKRMKEYAKTKPFPAANPTRPQNKRKVAVTKTKNRA